MCTTQQVLTRGNSEELQMLLYWKSRREKRLKKSRTKMVGYVLGFERKYWIKLGKGMRVWRWLINNKQRKKAHSEYNCPPLNHASGRLVWVQFSIQSLVQCLSSSSHSLYLLLLGGSIPDLCWLVSIYCIYVLLAPVTGYFAYLPFLSFLFQLWVWLFMQLFLQGYGREKALR